MVEYLGAYYTPRLMLYGLPRIPGKGCKAETSECQAYKRQYISLFNQDQKHTSQFLFYITV